MAQKVQVTLEDDIDGGAAVETRTFALDGRTYEIDLNQENSDELTTLLEKYVKAGRRQKASGNSAGARSRGASSPKSSNEDTAAIRAWARDQGLTVNDRGRVPSEIREAYTTAHG
ncbi:hypothetical protein ADK75_10660 [Streptomyces virginiae]|uniref:Lsr2-like protein n=1 Tax=Streptomyces virginiae TaxID=1961 RepID=A0A0L8MYU6_STRVG|nr:Lsr2 family protein [Streptomyces virginiae]KOG55574.1 hypothetical protein ADK75_10660 [Streptomyces virginiae]